jgi:hypothetical protein
MSVRFSGFLSAIALGVAGWAVSTPPIHAAEILAECELASVEDYKAIDINGDGVISREEYKQCLAIGEDSTRTEKEKGAEMMDETDETFAQYDVNTDGEITLDEFEKTSGVTMKK